MADKLESTEFREAHPGITTVDAFLVDLAGKAYGKRYPAADLDTLVTQGSSMCAAMPLGDVNGVAWDVAGMGYSDGDPDLPTVMVPGSLAPVPWADGRAQMMMRLWDDGPVWWEPRSVLEGVAARFSDLGLTPVVAIELEFYLISAERDSDGAPVVAPSSATGRAAPAGQVFNLAELDAYAPVIDAIQAACQAQGLPVTTIAKEYGRAQFEVNLAHVPDPMAAADHAVLMRRAVQGVARAHGLDATFMSKPFGADSGSGMQINLSFARDDGTNAFAADADLIGQAVGGMQAMLADSMAMLAANFHAFRRFEPDQFTPVTLDWGGNNRSVAFRVPVTEGPATRIEHRAAGAEANPYLVMAAVLAAAHHGLSNRLKPTEPATGNAGAEADPALPVTLWRALETMAASTLLPGYIEPRYIEAYVQAKQAEFDAFLADILPREHDWYL